jgi:2-amino-4-hydroxy-6-hydroxymethyldihydropteridine diphosphokinase
VGTPVRAQVAISLGSNLGDREARIRSSLQAIRTFVDEIEVSPLYETDPMYVEEQPAFLNACCRGSTTLSPHQLLSQLQDIERANGRRRGGPRFGPRTIDLDLLLVDSVVIDSRGLVVPHPRLHERAFVIVPLADVAADWRVPSSQGYPTQTVREILAEIETGGVRLFQDSAARSN